MTTTQSKPVAKPVFRKQLPGGISAAVFENTRDGRTYRSINLQRSYKHNGKWNRMGMYLDHEHIPFVIEVLQGTWNYLNAIPTTPSQATDTDQDIAEPQTETSDTPFDA